MEEFGLILLLRAYYNSIRKKVLDRNKLYIIKVLLLLLHDQGFIYHTRVSEELDEEDQVIT